MMKYRGRPVQFRSNFCEARGLFHFKQTCMSLIGTKRTSQLHRSLSAIGVIADKLSSTRGYVVFALDPYHAHEVDDPICPHRSRARAEPAANLHDGNARPSWRQPENGSPVLRMKSTILIVHIHLARARNRAAMCAVGGRAETRLRALNPKHCIILAVQLS